MKVFLCLGKSRKRNSLRSFLGTADSVLDVKILRIGHMIVCRMWVLLAIAALEVSHPGLRL